MTLFALGIIGVLALLLLILIGVPIGFAMAAIGVLGNLAVLGLNPTMMQMGLVAWEGGTNFFLIAVPLFILMGQLVYRSGIAADLYDCVYKWFGRLPGGLAVTATLTSAGFGAVTGSSVAAVATMGAMVVPEMKRYRYDLKLGTGSLAASGALAILIPPSIPMVIYGVWTETSIGHLFIAGILPGLLLAGAFTLYIIVRCLANRELGPPGPRFSLADRIGALWKLLPTTAVFLIVLGGIYGGVFTPTEASGVGCVGVLLVAGVMGRLRLSVLRQALWETVSTSAIIYAILIGGVLFSRFLVLTGLSSALVGWIGDLNLDAYTFIIVLVLIYLVLGAMLDTFGMLILTLPFVMPLVLELGYDPVWFGVFLMMMIELALITPPVGLNVYVLKNAAPDIPIGHIFRGAAPFVLVSLVVVALLVVFPDIALWLPRTM
ncbi:MAG: TRAP transporter large permease [Azospirillaceae bacterium]